MKLNIYEKRKIVKTYEAEAYDLMWGTVEDITEALNLDAMKTGSDVELAVMAGKFVTTSREMVNDFLKDVFEGITDQELKNVKVKEIVKVFVDILRYTITEIMGVKTSKN